MARTESVAAELLTGNLSVGSGKSRLIATRKDVESGWLAAADILNSQGHSDLAAHVRRFLSEMAAAHTDREVIATALLSRGLRPRAEAIEREADREHTRAQ